MYTYLLFALSLNLSQEPPAGLWHRAHLDDLVVLMKTAAAEGLYVPDTAVPFQVQPSQEVFESYRASLGLGV